MLGITWYLLFSDKDVFPHCSSCVERNYNEGLSLYRAARDSVVSTNENTQHFLQRGDMLIPICALPHAPHSSSLPCFHTIGHSSVETSFLPEEGFQAGKALRPEDWEGKGLAFGTYRSRVVKIRTSHLDWEQARLGFASLRTTDAHCSGGLST